jgi:hypothetical protein
MSEAAPDRFEIVAYVYSQSDLALLLSLFENEGIHVSSATRGTASVWLGLTTALGGTELRVHAEEAEDARALLGSLDQPPCRAKLFTGSFPIDLLFLVLMLYAFAVPPPPRQLPCFLTGRPAAVA